jgi:hypothetical protein
MNYLFLSENQHQIIYNIRKSVNAETDKETIQRTIICMNIYFYAQTICFRTVLPGIHLGRKIPVICGKETVEKIRLTRTFRTVQKQRVLGRNPTSLLHKPCILYLFVVYLTMQSIAQSTQRRRINE